MRYGLYLAGLSCVLWVVAAGCAGAAAPCPACPPAAQPTAVQTSQPCPSAPAPVVLREPVVPSPLPSLAWITQAARVRLERGRSAQDAAWVVHYDLRKRESAFEGLAILTATRLSQTPGAQTRQFRSGAIDISISNSVMQSFLEALARATPRPPPQAGTAVVAAKDDHPWWSVVVEADEICVGGRCVPPKGLRFSSPPNEARPSPWFLWASDQPVEVEPTPLSSACESLVPHLKDEALRAKLR